MTGKFRAKKFFVLGVQLVLALSFAAEARSASIIPASIKTWCSRIVSRVGHSQAEETDIARIDKIDRQILRLSQPMGADMLALLIESLKDRQLSSAEVHRQARALVRDLVRRNAPEFREQENANLDRFIIELEASEINQFIDKDNWEAALDRLDELSSFDGVSRRDFARIALKDIDWASLIYSLGNPKENSISALERARRVGGLLLLSRIFSFIDFNREGAVDLTDLSEFPELESAEVVESFFQNLQMIYLQIDRLNRNHHSRERRSESPSFLLEE